MKNKNSPPITIGGITIENLKTYIIQCITNAITTDPGASGEIQVEFNLKTHQILIIPREPCQFSVNSELYAQLYELLSVVLYPVITLRKTTMQLVKFSTDNYENDTYGELSRMRALAFSYIEGVVERLVVTKKELLNMRKGSSIPLTKGFYWDYRKYSHAIITGVTGSGKSYYLSTLLEQLYDIDNSTIIVVDPKISDGARWAKNKDDVKLIIPDLSNGIGLTNSFLEKINNELGKVEKIMYGRQSEMFENTSQTSKAYPDKPVFIFIDELAALASKDISKPLINSFWAHLSRICLLGRESNINLIVSLQKPLNTYIDTALREQFALKMTLGASTLATLNLLFDNLDSMPFIPDSTEKGVGIVSIGSQSIQPIYTPTIILGDVKNDEEKNKTY